MSLFKALYRKQDTNVRLTVSVQVGYGLGESLDDDLGLVLPERLAALQYVTQLTSTAVLHHQVHLLQPSQNRK